jgi:hypothetical protein
MVGDESVLSGLPLGGPGSGSNGSSANLTLPKLETVTVTADLDPVLALDVVGGAADAPAASSIADVVKGFVALATLQAAQKPELKGLQSALSVNAEGTKVRLAGRFPHELVKALVRPVPVPPAPQPSAPPLR